MSRMMKNSGIPWIGEIPTHWNAFAIKHIMRNKSVRGFPNERVLSLYREYGVVPKDSRDDNHNVTSEDTSGYKLVDIGDFVINKMKAWQGSMAVSEYRGIISPAYYICTFTAPVNKRYIHYLLRNDTYKAEYMRLSTGLRVGQWDLNVEDFLHIPLVLPPQPEQTIIAVFLDKKCGEIDEMVSLQERIIEELKAYKQSVITEVVTKGLTSNVPMKDSGVQWIGQIPEHWKYDRLKVLFTLHRGYDLANEEFVDQGVPVYGSGGFMGFHNEIKVKAPNIIIGRSGSTGKLHFIEEDFWAHNTGIYVSDSKGNSMKYLYYVLSTIDMDFLSTKTAVPTLDRKKIQEHPFVFTDDILEQQAIADYLDTKCAEIDTLISLKQSKIEKLKEYKKSIIYEYVTGKKEVKA